MRHLWAAKRAAPRNERIFVDENLTRAPKQLLSSAKQRAKEKVYKFVGVKNGKILVRQSEQRAANRIENDADLLKIS